MRTFARIVATAAVLLTVVEAHQRPNFSGRWVITSPPQGAGREQAVIQDEKTLTVEQQMSNGPRKTIYQLDGVERQQVRSSSVGDITILFKAAWEGDRIVITSNESYPNGMKTQLKEIWSLDAQGRLTIDYTEGGPTGPGPSMKVVFVKKP